MYKCIVLVMINHTPVHSFKHVVHLYEYVFACHAIVHKSIMLPYMYFAESENYSVWLDLKR